MAISHFTVESRVGQPTAQNSDRWEKLLSLKDSKEGKRFWTWGGSSLRVSYQFSYSQGLALWLLWLICHVCVNLKKLHIAHFQRLHDKWTQPSNVGWIIRSGQERGTSSGILSNCICGGSQQASDFCTVLGASCPVESGLGRTDVQSAVQRIQRTLTSCFSGSFLCLILSWFLGEMTLNSVSVNLDFNLENGNVLFRRATCPCSSKRDDWLCRIFCLRKLYMAFFWNVVGGMESCTERSESKLST